MGCGLCVSASRLETGLGRGGWLEKWCAECEAIVRYGVLFSRLNKTVQDSLFAFSAQSPLMPDNPNPSTSSHTLYVCLRNTVWYGEY